MRSVWIHGWASDSRVFRPLLGALPPAPAPDAQALDIPGYAPGAEYSGGADYPVWLANELKARHSDSSVVLGGWSMGAMLALEAAAAGPEVVSALVLISGCARFVRDDANPRGQDPRAVRAMLLGLRRNGPKVVADFLETLFSPDENSRAQEYQLDFRQDFTKINPAALSDGLNYLLTADLTVRLAQITCPVLLLHGSVDTVIDVRLAETLAEAMPGARLEVLDGAGHAPLWSRVGETAELIAEFIESTGMR